MKKFSAAALFAAVFAAFAPASHAARTLTQVCAQETKAGSVKKAHGDPVTGNYLEDLGRECSHIAALEVEVARKSRAACPGATGYMDCFKRALRRSPPRSTSALALYTAMPAGLSLRHRTSVPFDNVANLLDGLISVLESANANRFFVNTYHPRGRKEQAALTRLQALEDGSLDLFRQKALASIGQVMAKLSDLQPQCGKSACGTAEAKRRAAVLGKLSARLSNLQAAAGVGGTAPNSPH
ncbi:MAG TPA: hypothetical protein VNH15_05355 [Elusimicrobiota bacterium]|nr:hypothetical protein [Elusimicrobiota bacterium]